MTTKTDNMKASICPHYGSPDILTIREVEQPAPKDHELLVQVHATTVNRSDLAMLQGTPRVMRVYTGLRKPKIAITGSDFAGEVVAAGGGVTAFRPGDRVMGFSFMGARSHAQYLTIPENGGIVAMPANLSYEEAAACLEGTFYAACGVLELQPGPGQKALVNGATGAIGSATVQFLKHFGVAVTAVCRGEHSALVRSLGADRVIDYEKEDFTNDKEQYDFVFDAVGKSSFARCKPLLKKHGIYSATDGLINFLWRLTTRFSDKRVVFSMPKNIPDTLRFIRDLIVQGKFRPVIDRRYPFEQIADAYRYVGTGQKVGNVVLTMEV